MSGVYGPVISFSAVSLSYGRAQALDDVTLDIPAGRMVGLIGPDGVGKSSLLALAAGARVVESGTVNVLAGSMANSRHRQRCYSRIAYMPQGLGKNLYPTLSVFENVEFFGRLFGHGREERERRIGELLERTGLAPFTDRPASKLSGGMKQKLGLCCALIHDPDLLILDEPTTGVDPLARRQFWALIADIRKTRPGMSVVVATAYMEEAAGFDWLVMMNRGSVLATGAPEELLRQAGADSLESAFIALLPEEQRRGHQSVVIPPLEVDDAGIAIAAEHLTMRFGDFTAVDDVSFRISQGEIFGFLGSNGCGKSTTMKMLTGLLPMTEGSVHLFDTAVNANDMTMRRRVGYMSQTFSLYGELTVAQNLELHARLFGLPREEIPGRMQQMAGRFGLSPVMQSLPEALPLGMRQRLSLAVAMIHAPDILILDEPTSGVDPVARDVFWRILVELSRNDKVTIFISTHFMNEAERCDRVSLMHAGKVLVTDTPAAITASQSADGIEEAFIAYLEDAIGEQSAPAAREIVSDTREARTPREASTSGHRLFSLRRMLSYTRREALELRRDPIRATLAIIGSVLLMFVMGYGINLDVENLDFAVLDRDDTTISREYVLDIAGSRYFREKPPLTSYDDLDTRMKRGEIALAIEIPAGFSRDLLGGGKAQIGAWIDGSMPARAETVSGYVQGIHAAWLAAKARQNYGDAAAQRRFNVETRFRYNPDVKSLVAMVPAMIPLLLMMVPAMLTALSVVREKELGSIVNLSVTPVTKLEFLLGKQIPYVALGVFNGGLLLLFAVFAFNVPFKGSLLAFATGTVLYVGAATGMGLLVSSFMRSQITAIFATTLLTLIPALQFSGMIDPVSSLEGAGAVIGRVYPTTYFMTISRGAFSKGLDFGELAPDLLPVAIGIPVLLALAAVLLKKQAR